MTNRIQCPVCQYAHIPRDMDTCPQCDADLSCFRLLDRLSKLPPEPASSSPEADVKNISTFGDMPDDRETHPLKPNDPAGSRQKMVPLALTALTVLLVVFSIFLAYRLSAVEHLLQRQHTVLTDLYTAGVSQENDLQEQNQMLELVRKQQITLAHSARLKTYMADVKTSVRENGTRLDRIESRLSHLLSHREMVPILDSKKQMQTAIKPMLIISEALETDAGRKVIEIDME